MAVPGTPTVRERLLVALHRNPGAAPKDLAIITHCRERTVSCTLRALLAEGRVERVTIRDPYHDNYGRVGYVRLYPSC